MSVVAALTLAGCGQSTFSVTGMQLVPATNPSQVSGTCRTALGFEDMAAGTEVTVTDAAGTVIAAGALGPSKWAAGGNCRFDFRLTDIPAGEEFYRVEVGDRGTVTLREAEMRKGPQLTLGN